MWWRRRRFWLKLGLITPAVLLILFGAFFWWMLPGRYRLAGDLELPTRLSGDRFFVEPVTVSGQKLSLLTDTGGGLFLARSLAERKLINPTDLPGTTVARLPAFDPHAWIPEPTGGERWMNVIDSDGDGMLGQRWFAGGVWTFDYSNQKLILHADGFAPTWAMLEHTVRLGFKTRLGVRMANHPRFVVEIDGQPIEALFDTGATVWLSPAALKIINASGPTERATSFVTADLFDAWRLRHPQWPVIEDGCMRSHQALIQVPAVRVAGMAAGPVWFTRRDNGAYAWMSTYMDQPIAASVGGNFLRHFRVTLDYPNAIGYFQAP